MWIIVEWFWKLIQDNKKAFIFCLIYYKHSNMDLFEIRFACNIFFWKARFVYKRFKVQRSKRVSYPRQCAPLYYVVHFPAMCGGLVQTSAWPLPVYIPHASYQDEFFLYSSTASWCFFFLFSVVVFCGKQIQSGSWSSGKFQHFTMF